MKQSTGKGRRAWFWAGVVLLSISALLWLMIILLIVSEGDGIGAFGGVLLTAIPIGIGIYGIRRGRKTPAVEIKLGAQPAAKSVQESQQSVGSGGRVAAGLFGLIFFAAGVFIFLQVSLPQVMLRTTGIAIEGVVDRLVESKYIEGGGAAPSGESKYHVYYHFVLPEGEVIQGHTQIASSDWFSLRIGQKMTVLYLPNNPRHNCLADYQLWKVSVVVMIVFPPSFGGIGILLLLHAVRSKKAQSLARKNGMSKVPK